MACRFCVMRYVGRCASKGFTGLDGDGLHIQETEGHFLEDIWGLQTCNMCQGYIKAAIPTCLLSTAKEISKEKV